MSEFNKSELLVSLIAANYEPALAHAFALVTGGVGQTTVNFGVNNNGTNANLNPQVETPAPATNPGATDGQTGGAPAIDATTLDKRGFPWCAQIHAKTKTVDAKGNWKYAVGVDRENLVPAVEQQLRDQGYGQPAGTPAPTPAATPGAATPPPATQQPGLPPVAGVGGLPPIGGAVKTKVEFPVVASEEDMDDDALTQTAAALADKHGNEALKKLLTLFGVDHANGYTAKDIAAGHKYVFWQYATSDEGLRQQAVIS